MFLTRQHKGRKFLWSGIPIESMRENTFRRTEKEQKRGKGKNGTLKAKASNFLQVEPLTLQLCLKERDSKWSQGDWEGSSFWTNSAQKKGRKERREKKKNSKRRKNNKKRRVEKANLDMGVSWQRKFADLCSWKSWRRWFFVFVFSNTRHHDTVASAGGTATQDHPRCGEDEGIIASWAAIWRCSLQVGSMLMCWHHAYFIASRTATSFYFTESASVELSGHQLALGFCGCGGYMTCKEEGKCSGKFSAIFLLATIALQDISFLSFQLCKCSKPPQEMDDEDIFF